MVCFSMLAVLLLQHETPYSFKSLALLYLKFQAKGNVVFVIRNNVFNKVLQNLLTFYSDYFVKLVWLEYAPCHKINHKREMLSCSRESVKRLCPSL